MNRFATICGEEINLDEVSEVTRVGGDYNWLRYEVHLKNGREKIYYQERRGETNYFPRAKFIELLKQEQS